LLLVQLIRTRRADPRRATSAAGAHHRGKRDIAAASGRAARRQPFEDRASHRERPPKLPRPAGLSASPRRRRSTNVVTDQRTNPPADPSQHPGDRRGLRGLAKLPCLSPAYRGRVAPAAVQGRAGPAFRPRPGMARRARFRSALSCPSVEPAPSVWPIGVRTRMRCSALHHTELDHPYFYLGAGGRAAAITSTITMLASVAGSPNGLASLRLRFATSRTGTFPPAPAWCFGSPALTEAIRLERARPAPAPSRRPSHRCTAARGRVQCAEG